MTLNQFPSRILKGESIEKFQNYQIIISCDAALAVTHIVVVVVVVLVHYNSKTLK